MNCAHLRLRYHAEAVLRDWSVTGIQTCRLPISYAVFCLRSEKHTSELQSLTNLVCRLLLETEIAARSTDMIINQTTLQLQQSLMKNAISLSLADPALAVILVVPTDSIAVTTGYT